MNLIMKKNKKNSNIAKNSFLVIIRFGLWFKMRFIGISMVSWNGILVNRLFTSKETRNLPERFTFLIWEIKEKLFMQE